ncbi:transposase, partial [uncultured Vibrio sp.]|uniref:transposase n=1 Tax=uncultured Vibrio sp. TaxID=114054 RepID=UPI00260AD242
VDSYGLPIEFIITGGNIHDSTAATDLIELLPYADYLVADKGYDSEKIRDKAREQDATPVIPRRCNSKA